MDVSIVALCADSAIVAIDGQFFNLPLNHPLIAAINIDHSYGLVIETAVA